MIGTIEQRLAIVYIGQTVRLYCISLGWTRWKKNGEFISLQGDDNYMFQIKTFMKSDAGEYTCIGTKQRNETFAATVPLYLIGEVVEYILIGEVFEHK